MNDKNQDSGLVPFGPVTRPPDAGRRGVLRSGVGMTAFSLLGASSALLSACGGGGDGGTPAPAPSPAPAPPAPAPQPPAPVPAPEVSAPTLTGHAVLPADSFVAGPTSGQFVSGGDLDRAKNTYGYTLPFTSKQPMQGFSAMVPGPVVGTFYVMQDNGFGGRAASPDALLHIYAIKFDWDNRAVVPVNFQTGAALASFTSESYIRLSDPYRNLGYPAVADMVNYPGTTQSPAGQTVAVDPAIISGRLLTGYDIDPESMQIDAQGNLWIGDEFGPFLLKFDRQGRLLSREIQIPNLRRLGSNALIQTPNNPYIQGNTSVANLGGSGGLESMAINASRTKLYVMFEKEISGDDNRYRTISVFDIATQNFEAKTFIYRVGVGQRINGDGNLETEVYTPNDMVAINDTQFLVMEKDSGAGDVRTGKFAASGTWRNAARFKRVFKIDLTRVDSSGVLIKEEVADLMQLLDPTGIGREATIDGVFTFPMECVEVVTIVDAQTLMFVNDNNYPGGSPSRLTTKPDDNEFIRVRLPKPLATP
ncbi:esterase-like activity of phytase family protein [Variovorax arabinosiphilus]|uniref:esterase-like activity of phytase family protein n=1 Tax=Variovorax arabinosiphilus TaxID=3053498 RepID=UPI0025758EBE|nr:MULTISPECIES: esterase-like activity of phytase family protein [unclassified Variovorax]MDM0122250.1 esterase-like activity of phytase family protein [Variovorax sp. J2L1-78]MDM0131221.1 esterase-like activity of phytase family protein [Variovorax sp. J2L1-63]MDM0235013.1 esterase-like activity of phytase family protein [Variovorax sp. J2R1-6]